MSSSLTSSSSHLRRLPSRELEPDEIMMRQHHPSLKRQASKMSSSSSHSPTEVVGVPSGGSSVTRIVRAATFLLLAALILQQLIIALDVDGTFPCFNPAWNPDADENDDNSYILGNYRDAVVPVQKTPKNRKLHILYGLSGNLPEFMNEFEVSLKSVLMNAPLDADMDVHLVVDADAHEGVLRKIKKAGLRKSTWRNQINIYMYRVSEDAKERYEQHVLDALPVKNITTGKRVGVGGLFRLFSYEILPKSVESIVYLDNDVVILTHLDELNAVRDDKYMYQVGVNRDVCSGLMIINLRRFPEFWDHLRNVRPSRIPTNSGRIGDQLMLNRVKDYLNNEVKQRLVGDLPLEWHVHLAHGYRRHAHLLRKKRTRFGMLHFNGKRGNSEEWWAGGIMKYCMEGECANNTDMQRDFRQTWMLAEQYVTMPWSMALYVGRSHAGGPGKRIRITSLCPANEAGCDLSDQLG